MKIRKPDLITQKNILLSENLFPVVGIGASAGGLDAFKSLIKAIPVDSGMAYVIVQHLDPKHESLLPEILQKFTKIPVLEITNDIAVKPDHIYVIPSNKIMVANDGVLKLASRPDKSNKILHLPIDIFFESLAVVHQNHAIGVVLSGTASDGTSGLKAIKENGGFTFAQDEMSASYKSMPNSAVEAGVVDFVLSPDLIPAKLLEITKKIKSASVFENKDNGESEEAFRQIIALLRNRKGTDFTYYKQTTIHRRILRRMAINKKETPAHYLKTLKDNEKEQDILYQDMLIPVTTFFRNPESYDYICNHIFPVILQNKLKEPEGNNHIRIWIAGCSTGEEAYSIAICFKELLKKSDLAESDLKVQIFATDLSEPAILKARAGIYSKSEVTNIDHQKMQDYFTSSNLNYQLKREIRDMCVFANHNFLKDPPFGRMDMISCRNVLIYMEPYLQKKALATFHYALNPNGYLWLGKTETIGGSSDLFAQKVKNEKLYSRKKVPGGYFQVLSARKELNFTHNEEMPKTTNQRSDFQRTADDIILNKYSPVGVVVNEAMDIVLFRGSTGNFLEQTTGKPSLNVLSMAKYGLAFEIRNLLHKAKKSKITVLKHNIPLEINGSLHNISIEAIPLPDAIEPHFLILFHDERGNAKFQNKIVNAISKIKTKKDEKDLRIQQLEHELALTREDMRGITDDQEAVNEELQSANEELLSGSEELQSLNEELETSKEELQSTNEELTIINQEILSLNEQVVAARNYAEAIVENIPEPLLVLDKNLRIKSANETFYKTFAVNPKETEGRLIYEIGNKQWEIPELRLFLEKILPEKTFFFGFEVGHVFQTIGKRIMLLNGREIIKDTEGEKFILLTIKDITETRMYELKIQELLTRFQNLVMEAPVAICIISAKDYVVELANEFYLRLLGKGRDFIHKPLFESIPELEEQGFKEIIDGVLKTGRTHNAIEMEVRFHRQQDGLSGFYNFSYQAMREPEGNISGIIAIGIEVTEQVHARKKKHELQLLLTEKLETKIRERTAELSAANLSLLHKNDELVRMNKELEAFAYVSSHDLQEPLRKIQTFAGRIVEKDGNHLSEKGKNYFRLMRKSAARMQVLIQDLLAFSLLSTSERKFENVDLKIIVSEVISEMKENIDEKNAVIEIQENCMVRAIPFQFRQVIFNLISNSLKFSKPDVPPHIVISCRLAKADSIAEIPESENQHEYCQISVSDNGIGFEQEYKDKIFEVFQKLHVKDKYIGAGIGLAIVKKIVENHNGFIFATSELDKGAIFDIFLPVK